MGRFFVLGKTPPERKEPSKTPPPPPTPNLPLFKVGDVVRLNSGGPKMTVCQIDISVYPEEYRCMWFDSTEDVKVLKFCRGCITSGSAPSPSTTGCIG